MNEGVNSVQAANQRMPFLNVVNRASSSDNTNS